MYNEVEVNYLDKEFKIVITSFFGGKPAILNRAPEDCCPAEDPEVEWEISEDEPDIEFLEYVIENCQDVFDVINEQAMEHCQDGNI